MVVVNVEGAEVVSVENGALVHSMNVVVSLSNPQSEGQYLEAKEDAQSDVPFILQISGSLSQFNVVQATRKNS